MPEPTFAPERRGGGSKVGVFLGLFLLLAALAAGIWYWNHRANEAKKESEQLTEVSEPETVTEQPAAPIEEDTTPIEPIPAEDPEKTAQESLEAREKDAREKVNVARNGRECILIVATLSNEENADKLRQLLKEEDYEVFYQRSGQSHMVGIRFRYLKPAEIEEKKKALMALTGVNYIAVRKK